jgi:ATP-dependent exoDNAse (exonuclease V) beta subunit
MGPDRRKGQPEAGYRLLKRLAHGRKVGEAKRLLYVGITRARKELFLSGLAKNTRTPSQTQGGHDGLKVPKDSPLAWILKHTTNHHGNLISPFFNPAGPTVARAKIDQVQPLPAPVPFEAQPFPYLVEAPSELADTFLHKHIKASTLSATSKGEGLGECEDETEPAAYAAIRGTISHRVIEALWHDGQIPETERIATALATEGMNPDEATAVAQEIADELTACQKELFFQWLLDRTHPNGKSECAIEAVKRPGKIQTGVLDFVRQEGNRWWIVDFKTSRPGAGQTEEEFIKQQAEYYRPQLTAYQAMLAKVKGVDVGRISVGLYFTSLQQWHEMTQGAH